MKKKTRIIVFFSTFICNVFFGLSLVLFNLFSGAFTVFDFIGAPLFFYGAIFSAECMLNGYFELRV